jgi:hypothetical protein
MEFGMVVDTTITIGNIAEIVSIVGGGFLVVIRMGGDIRVMKTDMAHLKSTVSALTTAFDRLGAILTQVAVQDARLVALEKRIDELAHGRGFVQSAGVNGEYPR